MLRKIPPSYMQRASEWEVCTRFKKNHFCSPFLQATLGGTRKKAAIGLCWIVLIEKWMFSSIKHSSGIIFSTHFSYGLCRLLYTLRLQQPSQITLVSQSFDWKPKFKNYIPSPIIFLLINFNHFPDRSNKYNSISPKGITHLVSNPRVIKNVGRELSWWMPYSEYHKPQALFFIPSYRSKLMRPLRRWPDNINGWKILLTRIGCYSNTNWTHCFWCDNNTVDLMCVQPHY